MNTNLQPFSVTEPGIRGRMPRVGTVLGLLAVLLLQSVEPAEASMFKGEALDKVANVLAWVVLIIVPIVGIVAFWLVHILPEKIAEKKKHPQAKAIQTLCLLSLVFGGMLWPLAWLWAYTKPVLYKMAYGTDTAEHDHGVQPASPAPPAPKADPVELQLLRAKVKELETKLAGKQAQQGGMV